MFLGAVTLSPPLNAAQITANDERTVGVRARLTAAEEVAKENTACARCHQDVVKGYANNPHAGHGPLTPGDKGVTCAGCHGPGEAHIQSGGDKSKIFNPTEAAARLVDDSCLKCHAGTHAIFERSAHGMSNVSCVRCHSIHAARESEHLLTIAQPDLCFQCHEEERSQFSAPFRHKVVEGLVMCTDCHEPHGTFGEQSQRFPAQQDLICTKCHTEMSGPFKYEHDIVKTEGCIACHSPHGSPNSYMLNRTRVNTICLLCHFPAQVSSRGESLFQAHDPTAGVQRCTDCHADIHGSNVSAEFMKKK